MHVFVTFRTPRSQVDRPLPTTVFLEELRVKPCEPLSEFIDMFISQKNLEIFFKLTFE
jgi:hypothetical protein